MSSHQTQDYSVQSISVDQAPQLTSQLLPKHLDRRAPPIFTRIHPRDTWPPLEQLEHPFMDSPKALRNILSLLVLLTFVLTSTISKASDECSTVKHGSISTGRPSPTSVNKPSKIKKSTTVAIVPSTMKPLVIKKDGLNIDTFLLSFQEDCVQPLLKASTYGILPKNSAPCLHSTQALLLIILQSIEQLQSRQNLNSSSTASSN